MVVPEVPEAEMNADADETEMLFQPLDKNEEDEAQNVKEIFLKSLQEYGERVVSLNDKKSINAMKAMTRTLRKSMKCNPSTIQQQLHTFGKGGAASRKSKWGRIINPNPPAIAARLAPGSGPAPLGRHFKDRRGQVVRLIALLGLFITCYLREVSKMALLVGLY